MFLKNEKHRQAFARTLVNRYGPLLFGFYDSDLSRVYVSPNAAMAGIPYSPALCLLQWLLPAEDVVRIYICGVGHNDLSLACKGAIRFFDPLGVYSATGDVKVAEEALAEQPLDPEIEAFVKTAVVRPDNLKNRPELSEFAYVPELPEGGVLDVNGPGMEKVHRTFMMGAFELALKKRARGHRIGAILVESNGMIKSWAVNRKDQNPCSHAEVLLLQSYFRAYQGLPQNSVIYTTLQPCYMCAGLIAHVHATNAIRVYYGQSDPGVGQSVIDGISTYLGAVKSIRLEPSGQYYAPGLQQRKEGQTIKPGSLNDTMSMEGNQHKERFGFVTGYIDGQVSDQRFQMARNALNRKFDKYLNAVNAPQYGIQLSPQTEKAIRQVYALLRRLG